MYFYKTLVISHLYLETASPGKIGDNIAKEASIQSSSGWELVCILEIKGEPAAIFRKKRE